jgi:tetratricopeptide (TPR) repeat protein
MKLNRFHKQSGIRPFMAGLILPSLIFLITLFSIMPLPAADTAPRFDQANKFYEQGKYADALSAYDKLLEAGNLTEALYFNRGNALFKLGQLGRAIASYRQAEQLVPRDPDLRANLQFARTQARGGSAYHASRWHRWLGTLTLNEWTLLTATAFWLLFLLLALSQWRPALKQGLRNVIILTGIAFVFLGICLGAALDKNYFTGSAIVITGEAEVRYGPFDESQPAYKVRDGIELTLLDHKDGWYQVADQAQRIGWLRQDQVLVFEPCLAQQKRG